MATQQARTGGPVDPAPQIYLQPIAAPSILGLYGFAGATFIVAAHLAGWYGGSHSALFLAPFAAMFGGLAQFTAGMWAYKARDGLATAMHGMWGSFWLGYGILNLLFANGTLTEPTGAFPELGFWFVALAAITWAGTAAAFAVTGALVTVLGTLAAGSTIMAIAQITGSSPLTNAAGWVFVVSAIAAWYTASALMLEAAFGRAVLPVAKFEHAKESPKIAVGFGEPGVMHGQ